jgi:trans-feruloyl-CoA hydratase/vanillin synthase
MDETRPGSGDSGESCNIQSCSGLKSQIKGRRGSAMTRSGDRTKMSEGGKQTPLPGGRNVLVQYETGVAWVTMNRPEKRNAISPALAAEMLAVLETIETDDRCGVLVLTGAGESFSSGMDLKEYFRATDGLSPEARAQIFRVNAQWQWRRLMYYPKATIAMVNGWCFGGAFSPLIACDLAIAAEEASFGLSEINWGIIPAGNVTKSVSTVMNQRNALYYIMTGETFDGRRAAAMGLVNEAVPRAQLRERTAMVARTLLEKNPAALRAAKHAFRRVRDMSWDDAEDYLFAKVDQMRFLDPEKGRQKGMSQFLDEKTYRPGLGAYRRDR